MTHRENGMSKLSMTGMTSSGTLIVLFGMYGLYVRTASQHNLWLGNVRMGLTRADSSPCWRPVFRMPYRILAALARLAVRSGRSEELEIVVLRHQLMVLRRQIDRPESHDGDRSLLGALAAALPRPLRDGWKTTVSS